ncbi:hypothetical protein [Roseovarius sp.]|uniref:hypothetical protein n=1 Tax=Roseovarius sp. TaxID=1486281 RepID=UPI003D0D1326
MPIRFNAYTRPRLNAVEFFELAVVPMYRRFQSDMVADDLCCAAIILLDQMVDWIAVESGEKPEVVRSRFIQAEQHFSSLNLVARALKHRELDRGPNKGLRDVLSSGGRVLEDGYVKVPLVYLPERKSVGIDVLLEACIKVVAEELRVTV